MSAPMELCVDLGPMPSDEYSGRIVMQGLKSLLEAGELCDVELVVAGQAFRAHRTVLAAASRSFHDMLLRLGSGDAGAGAAADAAAGAAAAGAVGDAAAKLAGATVTGDKMLIMELEDISNPEAVRAMLNCIYGPGEGKTLHYDPGSEDANLDVLRLAQRFQIAQLQEQACRWLASNLTTDNVLQRLAACDEFRLEHVCEKILEQLTANPEALFVLANDKNILTVPRVLQELLVRVLKLLGCGGDAGNGGGAAAGAAPAGAAGTTAPAQPAQPSGKRAKKAGA